MSDTTTAVRSAKPASQRAKNAQQTKRTTKRTTRRGAAYIRYSVERDGKLSDQTQLAAIKGKAAAKEIDIASDLVFIDRGKSAGEGKLRPQLERLLDAVRAGRVDFVVVHKIDRFTRSLRDFTELMSVLREHGVELIVVDNDFDSSSAFGKMMLSILAMFAEMERDMIVSRNLGTAATRRDAGMVGGLAPYGFKRTHKTKRLDDGKLIDEFVHDDTQTPIVKRIVEAITRGDSLRSIANALDADGVPEPRNRRKNRKHHGWQYMTVRQIATCPAIAGWRNDPSTPDEYLRAPWEPIVSDEAWRTMLEALHSSDRRLNSVTLGGVGQTRVANLLSGILVCGRCGTPMAPCRSANGTLRYRCSRAKSKTACCGPSVNAADAEQHVTDELIKALSAGGRSLAPRTIRDDDRAAEIEQELIDLLALYEQRKLKPAEYMRMKAAAEGELQQIESDADKPRDSALTKLVSAGGDYGPAFAAASIETKRAIIRDVFPLVVCRDNGGKGKRVPIEDRIGISDTSEIDS